jgi:hypothetical protein
VAGSVIPCEIVGFVRLNGQNSIKTSTPIIDFSDLSQSVFWGDVDEVIIALPTDRLAEISNVMAQLEHICVPTRAIIDLGARNIIQERIFCANGLQVFDLHRTPAESFTYLLAQRAFDIIF